MLIYKAYMIDGEYYSPYSSIGVYNDFEVSKKAALLHKEDSIDLYIEVMELSGNEFQSKELWNFDSFEGIWKRDD